ncbi:MAG TPA: T9SS type A sorting domain-containing protein, partial [Chitinophagaceae bacterium]
IDGGAWQSETIPSIGANSSVTFVFVQTANLSALGAHTIRAVVDYAGDSFRENDTAVLDIVNTPVINSFPYLQDFETSDGHWFSTGKNNSWEYGTPASSRINTAASGTKAWKTNLDGGSSDNELSYLYSPCFDLTGMTAPTLSFSLALDIEDCGSTLCDGAWMEYSKDGKTWTKLGANGQGTNWYNKGGSQQLWSVEDYHRWHVATIPIPEAVAGMRFRFVMQTDPAVGRNGIAIDDIHVYDNTKGIYDGITLATPVTQSVSGNGWIDFTSGGKLIASIHPNNQNLGSTDVQAYINTTPVRYTATQYYHDRNITIKPATLSPADSVTVRFYFMDTETEALIAATGCISCSKPGSAYELGVSKYADIGASYENGTIADNNQGLWSFIVPGNVTKVPFDKGYYAEFKVKDFSEFWLNNGGFNRLSPLPVKLMDFNVQKQNNNDVLVRWTVAAESNVSRYEVEVARSNADLQAGNFIKLGEVNSLGTTDQDRNYSFTDTEAGKFGTRYYRLKIVDQDASFTYSPIRSVVFEDAVTWQIYPNPSAGKFNLVYQLSSGEVVEASVYDAKGRLIQQSRTIASGMLQKQVIDITGAAVSPGVYILRIHHSGTTRSYKLYKQ